MSDQSFSKSWQSQSVVALGELGSKVIKINQARPTNKVSELTRLDPVNILHATHLLMGAHNIVEVPNDKR